MIERYEMRCANPGCQAEALYFRSGSLHWIDNQAQMGGTPQRRTTRLIWLCAECSKTFVVQTWRPAGQQLRRSQSGVISIDGVRRKPPVTDLRNHPVSQSA